MSSGCSAGPTADKPAGQVGNPAVQATYGRLLAQRSANLAAALQAAQGVERTDIADLNTALNGLTAADLTQVYNSLHNASQQHLTAFENWGPPGNRKPVGW